MTAGVVSLENEIGNFLNHSSANNIKTPLNFSLLEAHEP